MTRLEKIGYYKAKELYHMQCAVAILKSYFERRGLNDK